MADKPINSNAFFISNFINLERKIFGLLNSRKLPYFIFLVGEEAEKYLHQNKMQVSAEDQYSITEIE